MDAITSTNKATNKHFGGKYHLHLQAKKSAEQETSVIAGG
jgi:hypothetical protein